MAISAAFFGCATTYKVYPPDEVHVCTHYYYSTQVLASIGLPAKAERAVLNNIVDRAIKKDCRMCLDTGAFPEDGGNVSKMFLMYYNDAFYAQH